MTVERGLRWADVDPARPREGMTGPVLPASVLDATPECLFVTGPDGRIVFANRRVQELTGFAPSDLEGASAQLLLPEDLRAEQRGTFESRCHRADGATIAVEVHLGRIEGPEPLVVVTLRDITEGRNAEARIAFLAYHDSLTGLPNRELFEELLAGAIARARRHDLAVAVVVLNLDNFRLVNDSLGHQAGDELLAELAARLRVCTRETDVVARLGGDEFLLLLADLPRGSGPQQDDQPLQISESVGARVHEALREAFLLSGAEFYASASLGISLFPRDSMDAQTLLKNADAAMHHSKRVAAGGSVVFCEDDDDEDDAMERLSLSTRLRRAVESQHWVLHYQPIVDLGDCSVMGVESLVRWHDPNGGIVPPGEFIPLAEEMGLIDAIGDWVVDEMTSQHRIWCDEGLDLQVSFNLSPRQLSSPDLARHILGKLQAGRIDPSRVMVEITESTAMADPDRTQTILTELRSWGLTLAIDDFGTGYSSFARLKHMPVQVLKIDRSFVHDVNRDRDLAGMVRAMIQLAQSLGMTPLAEGVETRAEYEFLHANGCRLAQGYLFSRPVPPDQIAALARGRLLPDSG
ncbi:MAG: EAL domain-containing protein [Actinomycetota bacterium]